MIWKMTLTMFAALAPCVPALAIDSIHWHRDLDTAWRTTLAEDRPLLLFLTSDQCHYCVLMKHSTWQDAQIAATVNQKFVAVEVNTSRHKRLIEALGIKMLPTTLLISPDRKILDRLAGHIGPDALLDRWNQFVPPEPHAR